VSDSTPTESPLCNAQASPKWGLPEGQQYPPLLLDSIATWQWEPGQMDPSGSPLPCRHDTDCQAAAPVLGLRCDEGLLVADSGMDSGVDHPVCHDMPEVQAWDQRAIAADGLWNPELAFSGFNLSWPSNTGGCEGDAIGDDVCDPAALANGQSKATMPVFRPPFASTHAIARKLAPRPMDAGSNPLAVCLRGGLDGTAWLEPAIGRAHESSDSHKVQLGEMTVAELYQSFLLKGFVGG